MQFVTTLESQNWLITPAASLAVKSLSEPVLTGGQVQPSSIQGADIHAASILDQVWLLVLTGVVPINFHGNSDGQVLHETFSFFPDLSGLDNQGTSGPLKAAIDQYHIPTPSTPPFSFNIGLSVVQWAPFATVNSISSPSGHSSFSVDGWRPVPFGNGVNILSPEPIHNLFAGIEVDVSVRGSESVIGRIAYHITLMGKIVFPVRLLEAPLIEIPDLHNQTLHDALIRLLNLGFDAHKSPINGDEQHLVVDRSVPVEGTLVPPGSMVTVFGVPHPQ